MQPTRKPIPDVKTVFAAGAFLLAIHAQRLLVPPRRPSVKVAAGAQPT